MNPETCRDCHPDHYRQWSGSMHAYAADDPVFLAMNARGQEETGGALGDFCVQCHAPMAVRTGATSDGLNLPDLPQYLKGVTCYFCHSVVAVEGTHNNPLVLADDGVMRGGIRDPVPSEAHRTAYSRLLDRNTRESSTTCGACHDVVTPAGVHLERTFKEWQETIFASDLPGQHLSCGKCHMQGDIPGLVADVPGAPLRKPRDHSFPGVDVALTDWPEKAAQLAGIVRELDSAVLATLCPEDEGPFRFTYSLENAFAGHSLPSGAAADRRAWVEIAAYDDDDQIIFRSGAVAEGQPVAELDDPQLWQIRDFARAEDGNIAHMFWDVRTVQSELLGGTITNDPTDERFYHQVSRTYTILNQEGVPQAPARVVARMHLRPIGLDILDDLIASGHLDAKYRERVPTFTLAATEIEWTTKDGFRCVN